MNLCSRNRPDSSQWWETYEKLNLCGGKIRFICEDDEDMIEITYQDGMLIDVGKPTYDEQSRYCITVVASDSIEGWESPLADVYVPNKGDLVEKLQEVIFKFRTDSGL